MPRTGYQKVGHTYQKPCIPSVLHSLGESNSTYLWWSYFLFVKLRMTKTDSKRSTPVTNCTCEWKTRINIGRGGGEDSFMAETGMLVVTYIGLFKVLRTENWYFQVHRYPALSLYGRCPWSIRVQINGCRQGKLVFFVLFNMARGFENVCEIISDRSKWKPRQKLSRSYLQRTKLRTRDKKSSWLLEKA